MKANELRLGNLIYDIPERGGKIISVNKVWIDDDGESLYFDLCNPIPLTEEWLLKFGFMFAKKSRYGNKYTFGMADWGFTIENSFAEGKWFFGHEFYDAIDESLNYQSLHFAFDVRYVHELQNIMFALTGQELEINEKV
jgi:hypothetical protein